MKNFNNIFESLPPGCALDLIRCIIHHEKFRGNKCTKLNSAKGLLKRKLIIKNKKQHFVPTKKGLILAGV